MKGIIVVDTPDCCGRCRLYFAERDRHTGAYSVSCRVCPTLRVESIKPDWCPIRPMPERKNGSPFVLSPLLRECLTDYEAGWNDCIDSIVGGGEP